MLKILCSNFRMMWQIFMMSKNLGFFFYRIPGNGQSETGTGTEYNGDGQLQPAIPGEKLRNCCKLSLVTSKNVNI